MFKNKKTITEADRLEEEWYEDAKEQTIKTLPKFINHLMNDYHHDYGTICKAMAACAAAATWACNKTEEAQVSGWQASCIPWEYMKAWGTLETKTGARLINFDDMLYPQYKDNFCSISEETFKALQEQATKILKEYPDKPSNPNRLHPSVRKHMQSIVDGNIPFGFKIKNN